VYLCRLCHDGVHDLYDQTALADNLCTLELLRADPAIRRHAGWVRKQRIARE
jgi:hypothetical protein